MDIKVPQPNELVVDPVIHR